MQRIAIIGAGAAGLMAAITASRSDIKIDLYEQNTKPAKKILASGNGRCNISNTTLCSADYFGQRPEFSDFALKNFGFSQLQKFCKGIGLLLNVLDDGRAYPLSNEAKSVALSFETYAKERGVEIFNEYPISQIDKKEHKFYLHTPLSVSEPYDKVLLCTGSEAAPQLGGSSQGYVLASSLGHTIIPTYPSLVQLHINSSIHEKLSGLKLDAEVLSLIHI